MKASVLCLLASSLGSSGVLGAPSLVQRDGDGEFDQGQPISGDGKGAPIFGQSLPHLKADMSIVHMNEHNR